MAASLWRGPGFAREAMGGRWFTTLFSFEPHLGFEVAFGLEEILEVAGAFDQQVAIHGVLFEDRHVALDLPVRNVGADGMDFDARAGLNAEGGLRRVGRGIVLHAFERDLGLQAIVFLIERADAFQALLDAGLRHGLPGVDDPAAEFGGGEDAFGVELEIAEEQRGGEAGARAAGDIEADIDLLIGIVMLEKGPDVAEEEAIAFEEALLAGLGLLELGLGIGLAEIEAGDAFKLGGTRRAGEAAGDGDIA